MNFWKKLAHIRKPKQELATTAVAAFPYASGNDGKTRVIKPSDDVLTVKIGIVQTEYY